MTSTLLDVALIAALATATGYAVVLHRELRRFKAHHGQYAVVLAQTGRAVEGVEQAIRTLQRDGLATAAALGAEIDRAQRVLQTLTAASADRSNP